MPYRRGRSRRAISANIRTLHKGPQYARTKRKFGAAVANRQAVAVAMRLACGKGGCK